MPKLFFLYIAFHGCSPLMSTLFSEAAVAHVRAYHPPADFKPPTMDDLPVPQGSWKTQNDSNQTKYNIHLIGGVTLLTFTLGFVSIFKSSFFCVKDGGDKNWHLIKSSDFWDIRLYSLMCNRTFAVPH